MVIFVVSMGDWGLPEWTTLFLILFFWFPLHVSSDENQIMILVSIKIPFIFTFTHVYDLQKVDIPTSKYPKSHVAELVL